MYIVHVVWSVSFSNVKLGALYNYVIPIVLMEPLNVYDYHDNTASYAVNGRSKICTAGSKKFFNWACNNSIC